MHMIQDNHNGKLNIHGRITLTNRHQLQSGLKTKRWITYPHNQDSSFSRGRGAEVKTKKIQTVQMENLWDSIRFFLLWAHKLKIPFKLIEKMTTHSGFVGRADAGVRIEPVLRPYRSKTRRNLFLGFSICQQKYIAMAAS